MKNGKIDYVPLEEYVLGVLAGEMPISFEKEALNKYIKDSYIHARELPPRNAKPTVKDFLPWPYFLPKELSYVELYRMKTECDKKAKAAQESKEAKETLKAKKK